MTRDDIIRMAREAGFSVRNWDDGVDEVMDGDNWHIQTDQVIDFANLVAAAERSACAQVCESMRPSKPEFDERYYAGCTDSAAAIRARKEK